MNRKRIRFTVILAATLLVAVLVAPSRASAQEMLGNTGFDTGIAGWPTAVNGGTLSWDATHDASGSALSGSYRVVHEAPPSEPGTYVTLFVTRCHAAPAGAAFFGGASLRFAENEPSLGRANVLLRSFSNADCTGTLTGITGADEIYAGFENEGRGVWTRLEGAPADAPFVLSAQSKSVALVLLLSLKAGDALTLNVDDAYLAPAGTPVCDGMPATIIGKPEPEIIIGTDASDVIVGRGGADQIDGKGGNDRICGGPGTDTIYGGAGDDDLFGEGGADTIYGAAGDDVLVGGGGNDTLYGGNDDDLLKGGPGTDGCDGGPGANVGKTCESAPVGP